MWYTTYMKMFEGRLNRVGFAIGAFIVLLCIMLIIAVAIFIISFEFYPVSVFILAICAMAYVLFLYVGIAVRRLHDINQSGLWAFILFIPVIGMLGFAFLLFYKGENTNNKYSMHAMNNSIKEILLGAQ